MSDYFEDESLGKAFDWRLVKRLLKYLKPHKWRVAVSIFLLLVIANSMLAWPYVFGMIVNALEAPGVPAAEIHQSLLFLVEFFCGLILLRATCECLSSILINVLGQRVMYDIRTQLFEHIQGLPLAFFDRNPVGRLMTRVTNDVETINEFLSSGVVTVFSDIFMLGGIVVWMCWKDIKLASILCVTVVPVMILATLWFKKNARPAYRAVRFALAKINAFTNENVTGMKVVQLYNRQRRNLNKFSDLSIAYRNQWFKTIFFHAVYFPIIEVLGTVAVAIIIVYGGSQYIAGAVSAKDLGTVIAFLGWMQMFFGPIRDLADKYNTMQSAMASSERVFRILDRADDIRNTDSPLPLADFRGRIEFRNVWFAYIEENWVLKDVSFVVEPGQRAAFVGATGAGKTSIISLMCRFYDIQRGQILIDGKDIREIDKYELRSKIGLVLQDVFLFSGDIQNNIRLGEKNITDEQVAQAAEYVNAARFIKRLPGAYNHEVQERGATLSTGERQLLSFARALAFNPKILILDEATSNIDTQTELLIQDAVEKLMKNRTSIVIAHRLSTIRKVDKIIVLHKGELKEEGSHEELLRKGGIYYRLYQLQYKDVENNNKRLLMEQETAAYKRIPPGNDTGERAWQSK